MLSDAASGHRRAHRTPPAHHSSAQVAENAEFDGRPVALRKEFRAHLKALAPHALSVCAVHRNVCSLLQASKLLAKKIAGSTVNCGEFLEYFKVSYFSSR